VAAEEEPDYRMSLASERTYLAYIRTSLALIAAGVAVVSLLSDGHVGLRRTVAIVLIGLGSVIAIAARFRWRQIDAAMRRGEPMPGTFLGPLIAVSMVAVGVLALVLVLVI
jgi:putative membrane protein